MGINNCDKCTFCKVEIDSVEHMLLNCPVIQDLWLEIKNWLKEIGFIGYNLSESKIILGDIENGNIPFTILLLSKKVIYDAFKRNRLPALAHIQNETKKYFTWRNIVSTSNTNHTSLGKDGIYLTFITKTKTKGNAEGYILFIAVLSIHTKYYCILFFSIFM